jgi:hypothetical protein
MASAESHLTSHHSASTVVVMLAAAVAYKRGSASMPPASLNPSTYSVS